MFSWAEHVFACLFFRTKLIFMPHGGRFLLNAPRVFPFHLPICLPARPSPRLCPAPPDASRGAFPKDFFPPQPLSQLRSHPWPLLSFANGDLMISPSRYRSCSLRAPVPIRCTGLVLGGVGRGPEAAQRELLPHQTPMGSAPSPGPAAWRRGARLGSSRLGYPNPPSPLRPQDSTDICSARDVGNQLSPREGQAFRGGRCLETGGQPAKSWGPCLIPAVGHGRSARAPLAVRQRCPGSRERWGSPSAPRCSVAQSTSG